MDSLIDDAIEALRRMPENLQEAAARVILNYEQVQDEDTRLLSA